jgi:hypothetical protein
LSAVIGSWKIIATFARATGEAVFLTHSAHLRRAISPARDELR